ncbi:sulfotransferase domain-containing protein [Subsaxibacter sp. CAU 1640]|uniref:sulfotransferase domain-containing protein n=1 Tax=Subsaxibacter sp. CAU 1640 TaxID=2933271 RepID=UPI0020044682|nr:sulfotransferase domain-containing protein [Subsaxibacter sp. CAU 1640]MCK7589903.1 sulfotransferase domain-containing protein [Subsaxibacter sp. CAU 1640]
MNDKSKMDIKLNQQYIKYNVFLIGAMKCGTSTIFKYLQQNPQICMPIIKEPEYFSKTLGHSKYKDGAYLDLFTIQPQHKYTFDGSTGYSKFPLEKGVPKRIFEANLNPKFIYIVRNPFDRIESHYNYMQKDLGWKNTMTSDHLINISNYQLQLKEYLKFFKKADILVLDFDELRSDPEKTITKIHTFLESDHRFELTEKIQNNKTKLVNKNEIRLKKQLNGKLKWIPKPIKDFFRNRLFLKRKKTLTSKQKLKIKNALQEDLLKFGAEFNINVEKWGFSLNNHSKT